MSLKDKNLKRIETFLDKLSSAYLADYEMLDLLTHSVACDAHNQSHLDWCLVHFKTDMVNIHKTIKNIQARLREIDIAGTKV